MMTMFANRSNPVKAMLSALSLALLIGGGWAAYQYAALRLEIARWDPKHAATDAAGDIQDGRMKIYLNGSFSASKVGLNDSERALVAHLPVSEAGVGCVISSDELFDAQREYATRYNRAIYTHHAGKPRTL